MSHEKSGKYSDDEPLFPWMRHSGCTWVKSGKNGSCPGFTRLTPRSWLPVSEIELLMAFALHPALVRDTVEVTRLPLGSPSESAASDPSNADDPGLGSASRRRAGSCGRRSISMARRSRAPPRGGARDLFGAAGRRAQVGAEGL